MRARFSLDLLQVARFFLGAKEMFRCACVSYIYLISIILMLYPPRYPVNIAFQGAAAKLSSFFRVQVCQVLAPFVYFLMSTSQNYTETIIRIRLSKYWRIFTSPSAR